MPGKLHLKGSKAPTRFYKTIEYESMKKEIIKCKGLHLLPKKKKKKVKDYSSACTLNNQNLIKNTHKEDFEKSPLKGINTNEEFSRFGMTRQLQTSPLFLWIECNNHFTKNILYHRFDQI